MTQTVLRKQLLKIKWQGGTLIDQANYEQMRRIIFKLEDKVRELRKLKPKFHYPDPTWQEPGLRIVSRSDAR